MIVKKYISVAEPDERRISIADMKEYLGNLKAYLNLKFFEYATGTGRVSKTLMTGYERKQIETEIERVEQFLKSNDNNT